MLILILVDIQYLQNVVFSFEQGSNGQNHFLSDSHPLDRKILPEQHFPFSLPLRGGISSLSNLAQSPIQLKKQTNIKNSEGGEWKKFSKRNSCIETRKKPLLKSVFSHMLK